MIEKHIVLEDIDPVIFYGVNNTNIQMIKALFPKLRIVARGNVIKVMGDEEEMCAFEDAIIALEKHCAQFNSLNEESILDIVKGNRPATNIKYNTNINTNTLIIKLLILPIKIWPTLGSTDNKASIFPLLKTSYPVFS